MPLLPYILYLLVNKNSLGKKHYFVLFLVGLNSSLAQDIFAIIFLIPLSFIINRKKFFLHIHIKVFLAFLIPLVLTSLHVVIGSLSKITIHREVFDARYDLIISFINSLKTLFLTTGTEAIIIFKIPLSILLAILLIASFFF